MTSEIIIKDCFKNAIFNFNCNRTLSNNVIQMSRVNQALCDEAEAGRAHGEMSIVGNKIIIGEEHTRILLHNCSLINHNAYTCDPFDYFSGGEPMIEGRYVNYYGTSSFLPLNGLFPWNTQNIYLRASIYSQTRTSTFDALGLYSAEYQQAKTLGNVLGFSGNWGDKNRNTKGNWSEDASMLTTFGDSKGLPCFVCDATTTPQYRIELLPTAAGTLLLPFCHLKRQDFIGPRRVFFAPEENITIGGSKNIARPDVTDVIICYDPGMMFMTFPDNIATGCIFGGANAVSKSNFTSLDGKKIWLMLFDDCDPEEVNFVVTCAAILRKKRFSVNCIRLIGDKSWGNFDLQGKSFYGTWIKNCRAEELTLPQLRKFAQQHNIFIPEELNPDYLGDITAIVNAHETVAVITSLFNSDDIVLLNTQNEHIALMLIAYFARTLNSGTSIFPGLWENGHFASLVFVDHPTDMVAGYLRGSGVRICDSRFIDASPEEGFNVFQTIVGTAQVVFFAGYEVWAKPTVFLDAIRWCRRNRKAVVILPVGDDSALLKKVRHMTSKFISVSKIDGDAQITASITADGITSVAASFGSNGDFLSAKELSLAHEEQVIPVKAIPSTPYNSRRLEGLASLPPEKKLPAIAERNNHEKNLLK